MMSGSEVFTVSQLGNGNERTYIVHHWIMTGLTYWSISQPVYTYSRCWAKGPGRYIAMATWLLNSLVWQQAYQGAKCTVKWRWSIPALEHFAKTLIFYISSVTNMFFRWKADKNTAAWRKIFWTTYQNASLASIVHIDVPRNQST